MLGSVRTDLEASLLDAKRVPAIPGWVQKDGGLRSRCEGRKEQGRKSGRNVSPYCEPTATV